FIAARFSSGSSFHQILPLKVWIVFSSVYVLWAWKIVSGLKLGLWFLGVLIPFIQNFVALRWKGCLVCSCLVCEVLLTS
ncbi:hypothetical protein HID58_055000, partial [Brassica napus]